MKSNSHLVWIDMEMTGLDPKTCHIIELATVVTDSHLNIIAEGPVLAIHQSDTVLAAMDAWNTRQHHHSGLVPRVRDSIINEQEAEQRTLAFLQQWLDPGYSPMCGNSICLDKRFLVEYMPKLAAFFHYRLLDVSSVKELVMRWRPALLNAFSKQSKHLALDDIRDSIAELRYYREHFIRVDYD